MSTPTPSPAPIEFNSSLLDGGAGPAPSTGGEIPVEALERLAAAIPKDEPLPERPDPKAGDGLNPMLRREESPEDMLDAYWRLTYQMVDKTTGQISITGDEQDKYWFAMINGEALLVTVPREDNKAHFVFRDLTNQEIDYCLRAANLDFAEGLVSMGQVGMMSVIRFYQIAIGMKSTGLGHAWSPFMLKAGLSRDDQVAELRKFVQENVQTMSGVRWNFIAAAAEIAALKFKMLADSARQGFFNTASGTA